MTQTQKHHCLNNHLKNVIRRKSVVNTGNMNLQTNHQASILIRLTKLITDANDERGKEIKKYFIK